MRFPVVLHTDDGVRYGVTVPDLPGCFSAGDTFDDALDSVVEAIDLHLEGLTEEGDDIPVPPPTHHPHNQDSADVRILAAAEECLHLLRSNLPDANQSLQPHYREHRRTYRPPKNSLANREPLRRNEPHHRYVKLQENAYQLLYFQPACLRMLFSVPFGISLSGCFTVTRPGLPGCLKW